MRRLLPAFAVLILFGCIPQGHPPPERRQPPRPVPQRAYPRPAQPPRGQVPEPTVTRQAPPPPGSDDPSIRACRVDLDQLGVQYQPLPDRDFGGGCYAFGTVKLIAMGMPTTNLGAMTCPLALAFSHWATEALQPAARAWLGSPVVKVESFGTYSCRPVNGVAGNRLSEHGRSNAVDVSGFDLADGRRVMVLNDWNGPDVGARNFLRAVHDSACRRFGVVLGPDANSLHQNHLHFDMGGSAIPGHYCR